MLNQALLTIQNYLSQSNTDMTALEVTAEKARLTALYTQKYGAGKFTDEFFLNNPWHFKSLKSLLGEPSNDWYSKRIKIGNQRVISDELSCIYLYATNIESAQSYDDTFNFDAKINIKIVTDTNDSKGINLLDQISTKVLHLTQGHNWLNPSISKNSGFDSLNLSHSGIITDTSMTILTYNIFNLHIIGL